MSLILPVESFLQDRQVSYRLIPLRENAFTVDDVVRLSLEPVTAEEICKTIIIRGKKSSKKYAIFLQGLDKLDFSAAKRIFGEEMTIASAVEVEEVAGVEPGAVCPFLLTVPLYVDRQVLNHQRINCGSGHHLYGLEFAVDDLGKGVDSTLVDIIKTRVS